MKTRNSSASRRVRRERALKARQRQLTYWQEVQSGTKPPHRSGPGMPVLTPQQVSAKVACAQRDVDALLTKLQRDTRVDYAYDEEGGVDE